MMLCAGALFRRRAPGMLAGVPAIVQGTRFVRIAGGMLQRMRRFDTGVPRRLTRHFPAKTGREHGQCQNEGKAGLAVKPWLLVTLHRKVLPKPALNLSAITSGTVGITA